MNEKRSITDVAAKVDEGILRYRVHVKGKGWLGWVTGYDWNDAINGYAGNGMIIDAIQFYYVTPDGYVIKRAKYRVSLRGQTGYLPYVYDDDDFAGIMGREIDMIQLCIE